MSLLAKPESSSSRQYNAFSVLIVDDEVEMQIVLKKALSGRFSKVDCAGSIEQAEQLRTAQHYDVVILDIHLPGRLGIEWKEIFAQKGKQVDVIFITGYATIDTAISALQLGARDFILKPFNLEQIFNAVDRCMQRRLEERKQRALSREVEQHINSVIVGNSEKTKRIRQLVQQYAPSKASVLIEGESGTGKELIARSLHQSSERPGPFVAVNCSVLSPQQLEKELFGENSHQSGEGLLRLANNGTLFLDEIGELTPDLQGALLTVLEKRILHPLGSKLELGIDVRIIAATSHDLKSAIAQGRFRSDLFYRLAVLKIDVAPLHSRMADLIDLVPHFTKLLCGELSLPMPGWAEQYIAELHNYDWPGNLRELRNILERCLLLNKSPEQYWSEMMHPNVLNNNGVVVAVSSTNYLPDIEPQHKRSHERGYPNEWNLKEVEKAHILKVISHHDGNKSSAARELGISRKTLERKFKEWEEGERNGH